MSCRGWCLTLADGRQFAWNEWDGVRSADEAFSLLFAQEPDVEIVSVEDEEILASIELGHN